MTPFQESWVFCHFAIPPIANHIIYYIQESDELFSNLNYCMYYELGWLWFILALFCIHTNHLFFWFVQIDFTLNSCLWIHFSFSLKLSSPYFSWVYIVQQNWKLTRFFTLIPLNKLEDKLNHVCILFLLQNWFHVVASEYILKHDLDEIKNTPKW
jgi:hypothetical protein